MATADDADPPHPDGPLLRQLWQATDQLVRLVASVGAAGVTAAGVTAAGASAAGASAAGTLGGVAEAVPATAMRALASLPSLPSLPPLPAGPASLSAAQLQAVASGVAAQRQSIAALRAQLDAFDDQLGVLERILGPLVAWSETWADLENRVTRRDPPGRDDAQPTEPPPD